MTLNFLHPQPPLLTLLGELFASCKYDANSNSVEPVTDSSRYFVIRVENERGTPPATSSIVIIGSWGIITMGGNSDTFLFPGQHSFIGLGFQERTDSFDFNVCLQDHMKHLQSEKDAEKRRQEYDSQPKKDYSLAGQNITINLPGGATPKPRPAGSTSSASSGAGGFSLPPPPGKGHPVAAPSFQPQPQKSQPPQQQQSNADWGDFNDFSTTSQGLGAVLDFLFLSS